MAQGTTKYDMKTAVLIGCLRAVVCIGTADFNQTKKNCNTNIIDSQKKHSK